MKTLAIMLFSLLLITNTEGQKNLSLKADKYNLEIKNYFGHSIHINVDKPNGNDTIILADEESGIVKGRYSKSKLQKTKLICSYNEQTFSQDREKLNRWKKKTRDSLIQEAKVKDSLVFEDFKISLERGGSAVQKNRLAERNSIYVNLSPSLKSYLMDIKAKSIRDYNDLERTILIEHFDNDAIDKMYEVTQDLTNQELNDSLVNAILYTADKLSLSKENRVTKTLEAEEFVEDEITRLSLLKNDIRFSDAHTYPVYQFLNEFTEFKGKAPDIIFTINPISFGGEMNESWEYTNDNVYRMDEENDKTVLSDGLINRTIGASLHFPIFREFYFSENLYSRLHAGLGFYNMSFTLNQDVEYSESFFSSMPSGMQDPSLNSPLVFEQQQFSVDLLFKSYLWNFLTVDLFAGIMAQQGAYNFRASTLASGFDWTHEYERISNRSNHPFFGYRIGIGSNGFHSGAWITIGTRFFKIDHENTSDLVVTKKNTNQVIELTSNGSYFSHTSIGLSFAF